MWEPGPSSEVDFGPPADVTATLDRYAINPLTRRSFLRGVSSICRATGVDCDIAIDKRGILYKKVVITLRGRPAAVHKATEDIRAWSSAFSIGAGDFGGGC